MFREFKIILSVWILGSLKHGSWRNSRETDSFFSLNSIQDRLTVSPDIYPSISVALSKIHNDGGIGAFYAGISPTLIGMLPYSTCYYFMYETMKKSYCTAKKKTSLSRPEMLLIGALSGDNLGLELCLSGLKAPWFLFSAGQHPLPSPL